VLESKLKGNMVLIEGKQIIWEEIISEMKKLWEHIKLVAKHKVAVKTIEFCV